METSPALDGIAEEGIVFERHYSTDVPTPPAYTAMLTAQRGQRTGIFGFGSTNYKFDGTNSLLAEHLTRAGYRTGMLSNLLYVCPWLTKGFHDITPPGGRFQGGTASEVTEEACGWLDSNGDRDFFLFVHYWDPHSPYFRRAPEEYQRVYFEKDYGGIVSKGEYFEKYPMVKGILKEYAEGAFLGRTDFAQIMPAYDACIRYLDDSIAKLMGHVKKLGIDDETLMIFTSDHGEAFGERGFFDHISCYENISHVPLIVRWPKRIDGKRRVPGYSLGVDLMPTILGLCGLPVPENLSGKSLKSVLLDDQPTPHQEVVTDCASVPIQRMYIRDGWALVHTIDRSVYDFIGTYELFDLSKDKAQENDLAPSETGKLRMLKGFYEEWLDGELRGKPDKLAGIPFRGGGWSLKLLYRGFYTDPELYYSHEDLQEVIDNALGPAAKRYYRQVTGKDPG
jgi:arylsulfatase A-like enzyme